MADTKIEWANKVWNPVVGCTPVSEGCAHCYAKRIFERFNPGEKFSKVKLHPERLNQPFSWIKKSGRVFVNSMSDLFHPDVPDEYIAKVLAVCILCEKQKFLILTKRPERMNALLTSDHFIDLIQESTEWLADFPPSTFPPFPNIWLGVTAENQMAADVRIPLLLQTPAAVRFVSVEPMLGPVDLRQSVNKLDWLDPANFKPGGIDWVICGGETGPGARPMDPDWVRSLRDHSVSAGVPFFFKSWGEWAPNMPYQLAGRKMVNLGNTFVWRLGKKTAGRELDGKEWNEYPKESGE